METMQHEKTETTGKKQIDQKKLKGGRQTLFRVTYRNQINLIQIADSKANMILGINVLIISLLIGIISSKFITSEPIIIEHVKFIVPIILIILTALLSATYSIRAVKPRLILPRKKKNNEACEKCSMLFFENIYHMTQAEYLNKMSELISSSVDVYENMIIDVYNQARVLHQKYSLLRISYFIFLVGFIVSVLVFVVMWLLYNNQTV